MTQKQVIFIFPYFSTFVEKDYLSLKKKANVLKFGYKPEKQLFKFVYELIKLNLFLIKHIRKTDIIYCWFADYHSFFPMLLGKIFKIKTIIIVGGFDAVSIPELEYGIFYKKGIRRFLVTQSFKLSKLILPVHKSLISGTNYYVEKDGLKTGVANFVSHLNSEFFELSTGYDKTKWFLKSGIQKEQSVITVAAVNNIKTFKLKGLDLFIEVARKMTGIKFIIIGVSSSIHDLIKKDKPENLIVYEYVENYQLVKYYANSKVYCQFSLSEGLPNALCEAMLCECVPVGSDVNGIPDGIGDTGFILKERDVNLAAGLIQKALNSDESLGKKARQHIIDKFSQNKREQALFQLLDLK